ncbi:MAG TPA: hypothetical protein VFJ16_32195 [Longimicrobium sp.]|nr:hypothetical protein [Longimicrobium sp.]
MPSPARILPLLAVLSAAVCGREPPAPPHPPLPAVQRLLYEETGGSGDAKHWTVRDARQWEALWNGLPDRAGRTMPVVDFSREMVVVVTAGRGSSGSPGLAFEGYQAHGDTTDVWVRRTWPCRSCGVADDVTNLLVAGRIPRRDGPVRIIRYDATE